jgi:hypothetical protein
VDLGSRHGQQAALGNLTNQRTERPASSLFPAPAAVAERNPDLCLGPRALSTATTPFNDDPPVFRCRAMSL